MVTKSIAVLGSRGIPARYGGFETFAEELAVRLAGRGVRVTVYCEKRQHNLESSYKGVSLVHLPYASLGFLTTLLFDVRCLWHARRAYDVVYMLGYGASPFCFLPRLFGTIVWINVDGIEWARSKWNWVAKAWLKFCESAAMYTASTIIADAHAIRSHIQDRHSRVRNCVVIPYGAPLVLPPPDESCLAEFDVRSGHYYLVVCRLEPENHVLEIIRGYLAAESEFPLLVFGDRQSRTTYVKHLLKYESATLRFVGTLFDSARLQALRWHCRAYLHGHSVGGTNPSLLEALGCGNLVIAHDNPFNREVVSNSAYYFKTENDVSSIIEWTDHEPVSESRRNRSWDIVRNNYTWESVTDRYLELLSEGID